MPLVVTSLATRSPRSTRRRARPDRLRSAVGESRLSTPDPLRRGVNPTMAHFEDRDFPGGYDDPLPESGLTVLLPAEHYRQDTDFTHAPHLCPLPCLRSCSGQPRHLDTGVIEYPHLPVLAGLQLERIPRTHAGQGPVDRIRSLEGICRSFSLHTTDDSIRIGYGPHSAKVRVVLVLSTMHVRLS